ncbi:hypothetical protein T484DRAFT_1774256 [Baffinella frigidus]|nr:hypothetical protein T484DRAFT_1774256 [Cryptophyta sp. CCMP2293]
MIGWVGCVRPGSNWAQHKPKHVQNFGIPEGFDDGVTAGHDGSIDKLKHVVNFGIPEGFDDGVTAGHDGSIDKVPLETGMQTQMFVNISMGTPRQEMRVILDTGSSVFAVFCDTPPKKVDP